MESTSKMPEKNVEWIIFKAWQESYEISRHGFIAYDEWLDYPAFKRGGIRGHVAPRCFMCQPIVEEENAQIWGPDNVVD